MSSLERTWARALVAGISYAVVGGLAIQLAVPPVYSTAVWPSAGLALAFVMVWGARVAPAIAAGAFAMNLATLRGIPTPEAAFGSVIIGLGVAAQALAGARWAGARAVHLADARSILRVAVLAGPAACAVSPTVGVGALLAIGAITPETAPFSWWTWWVGDSIGVVIFAPLVLLWVRPASPRRRWLVSGPLVVGFAAVTVVFMRLSAEETARLAQELEARARPITHALQATLGAEEAVVGALAGLFDASDEVTGAEFRRFSERAHPPGTAHSLAWYAVTPAGAAARAPVEMVFHEPATPAGPVGLTPPTDPTHRAALEAAARTGRTTASGLLMVAEDEPAVVLVAPVAARAGARTATGSSALDGVRGFAVVVVHLRSLLDQTARGARASDLSLTLGDDTDAAAPRVLVSQGERAGRDAPSWHSSFTVGDRRWTLTARRTAGIRSWATWTVLAGGLALLGVLGMVMLTTTAHTAVVERLLEAQTREAERASRAERERAALTEQLTTLNGELEARVERRTEELRALAHEREVLLQEIHHRVRNNLQVISSILQLQRRRLEEGPSRDALADCQARVQAIAMVHRSLYTSKDFARVSFADYARELVDNVRRSMATPTHDVRIELALADLPLPVDRAIPCALVLNELVSNAFKHAFRGRGAGTIRVELARPDPARVRLSVSDDGVGLPGQTPADRGSIGREILGALTQQLDGTLEASDDGRGARFTLVFPLASRDQRTS